MYDKLEWIHVSVLCSLSLPELKPGASGEATTKFGSVRRNFCGQEKSSEEEGCQEGSKEEDGKEKGREEEGDKEKGRQKEKDRQKESR